METALFALISAIRLLERIGVLVGGGYLLYAGVRVLRYEIARRTGALPPANVVVTVGGGSARGEGEGGGARDAATAALGGMTGSLSLGGLTQGALVVLAGVLMLNMASFNRVELDWSRWGGDVGPPGVADVPAKADPGAGVARGAAEGPAGERLQAAFAGDRVDVFSAYYRDNLLASRLALMGGAFDGPDAEKTFRKLAADCLYLAEAAGGEKRLDRDEIEAILRLVDEARAARKEKLWALIGKLATLTAASYDRQLAALPPGAGSEGRRAVFTRIKAYLIETSADRYEDLFNEVTDRYRRRLKEADDLAAALTTGP